jgi:hypothetical protein
MFSWMRCLNYCLIWISILITWFCSFIWELISLSSLSWLSRPKFWINKTVRPRLTQYVRHWWFSYRFWCIFNWPTQSVCWHSLNWMCKIPFARVRNLLANSAEKLSLRLALMKLFMVALGICYPSILSLKDFLHFYYKLDSFYRA